MGSGKPRAGIDVAALCGFVTTALEAAGDPQRAGPMAAYMKTDMPFFGVQKADRVPIVREMKQRFAAASRADYERAVSALWRLPHREEKYLALAMARADRAFVVPASLPLYERMIREGAWWDLVNEIAVHLVGRVLADHPGDTWPVIDRFIADPHLWIRRTAIICQLQQRERTDEARLFRYCLACASERDFFIRKAIGWALRQYARTRPDRVRAFLADHPDTFAPLTIREATKHL